MSSITCPRCGSQVPLRRFWNPASKPFCARCGWNLDRAEAAIAGKNTVMKLLPLGIAAVGVFAFFASSRAKFSSLFFIPALFALIALIPLWSYYSSRKALAVAKSTVDPSFAVAQLPLDPLLQRLQSLPRPRSVRFRLRGGSAVVVVAFGAIALVNAVVFTRLSGHPASNRGLDISALIPLLAVLLVLAIFVVVFFVRERRNLPLLRDGELAFARVITQQTIQQGKTSYSRIHYEFQTNTGQSVHNSARDLTGSVFEDMTIPVFYDSLDPSKNITPCATYLKFADSPF